mgnify:FL=1
MSHFARVNKTTNKVTDVLVITQLEVYGLDDSEDWFQTSYNESDGKPFAQIGATYDRVNNVFIPPQPVMSTTGVACTSWTWNSSTYEWEPPVARPSDYKEDNPDQKLYAWVEETKQWERHYSAEDVANDNVPDPYKIRVGISTS